MAYSFQTFSIGQILTAAQMNQVEASIRDHVHGTAGVSAMNLTGHITSTGLATVLGSFTSAQLLAALTDETGTGVAVFGTSPVFTTQISTPKIVTASGDLTIVPATGSSAIVGDGDVAYSRSLIVNGGTDAGKGSGVALQRAGTGYFDIYNEAVLLGSGSSTTPCLRALAGLGIKVMVNAGTTHVSGWTSAGVFYVGAASEFAVSQAGLVTAGTVPLARMMRTEAQNSAGASSVTLDLGTVVEDDRIWVTGIVDAVSGGLGVSVVKSSGTAVVDFAGAAGLYAGADTASYRAGVAGICRVTTGGTLVLILGAIGFTSPTSYIHAIVLNNG